MTRAERWVARHREQLLEQLTAEQDDGWWTVTGRRSRPAIRIVRYTGGPELSPNGCTITGTSEARAAQTAGPLTGNPKEAHRYG